MGLKTDMDILNAEFDFSTASADDQGAFPGRRADKVRIPANFQLYKFTQHLSLVGPNGITPWWSAVKPAFGNVGLKETLRRAGRLDVDPSLLARTKSAVTTQWNDMTLSLIHI